MITLVSIPLLATFGIITGFIAGFFGVGGGMILIPMLLLSGIDMKSAIAISILQMVYTSTYGSYLNYKTNKTVLKDGLIIGIGGFTGGLLSGIVISNFNALFLQYMFLSIVIFAIYRVYITPYAHIKNKKTHNKN